MKRALAVIAAVLLSLVGLVYVFCGPPGNVSECSVHLGPRGALLASVKLQGYWKQIDAANVLIYTGALKPRGNVLFAFSGTVDPWRSRTIQGSRKDSGLYSFKDSSDAGHCELDFLQFHDGSYWERGSPL